MHKSVTLSLFLMSSLIMLVPFTSINIFSNAMAQGYDNNYEDRYFDKANSYSYNYHNDQEKYSDYPDKINKYECQKGPMEGFFVSSPEFCIKKITPDREPEPPIKNPPVDNRVYVVWGEGILTSNNEIFISKSTDNSQTFGTPTNISKTMSTESQSPSIVASGNNVYAVWEEGNITSSEIFLSTSTDGGQTFSIPKNISNTPSIASSNPDIAVSGNNVHVVWDEGILSLDDEIFISTSTDGGQTFSTPKNISNTPEPGDSSSLPSIAVSGNNVHVVWVEEGIIGSGQPTNVFLATSIDNGQTFSAPKNISNKTEVGQTATLPSIAVSGNNVHVVWHESGSIFITTSTDNGQTFSTPESIFFGLVALAADIAVSGNNVYVVWTVSSFPGSDIFIATSTDNGQTFSTPKNITNTPSIGSFDPVIAVSGNNVHVVWVEDGGNLNQDIFIFTSTDGGQTFNTPKNISNNNGLSGDPDIAIS